MLHHIELCPNDISISTVQEGLGYRETSRKQSLLHPILPVHLQVKSDSCHKQTWENKDFREDDRETNQQQSQDVWEDNCCITYIIRLSLRWVMMATGTLTQQHIKARHVGL